MTEPSDLTIAYNKIEEDLDSLGSTPQGEEFSKEAAAHIQDIFAQLDVLKTKFDSRGDQRQWQLNLLIGRVEDINRGGKGVNEDVMWHLANDIQQFVIRNFKIPDNPLVQAIKSGDTKLAHSLFDKKQFFVGGKSFGNLWRLLNDLAEKGDIEMLKLLVKNNIDINIMVHRSSFATGLSTWKEDVVVKLMQFLIDSKADFNYNSSNFIRMLLVGAMSWSNDKDRNKVITSLKMLFINDCIKLENLQNNKGLISCLEAKPEILRLVTYFGFNPPEEYFSSKDGKEIYEQAKKVRDEAIVEVLKKSDALPEAFQRDPFQEMLKFDARSMQELNPELREKALQICLDHDAKAKE